MVQLAGEARLDACSGNHRADLADTLPDHPYQLWICVCAGVSRQGRLAGGIALRSQSRVEPDLHADPVRDAEFAAGCGGYSGRLDHNHLVRHRDLAAFQMGCCGSGAVFPLGVIGDGAAVVDHGDELGEVMIRNVSVLIRMA